MSTPRTAEGTLPQIVQGDTWAQTLEIEYSDTGNPVDLTGATLTVRVEDEKTDETVLQQDLTINDAQGGIASWQFSSADTEGLLGRYTVELEVTDSTGATQTWFQAGIEFIDELPDQ